MRTVSLIVSILFLSGCSEYFEHQVTGETYCNRDLNGRWLISPLTPNFSEEDGFSVAFEISQPEECKNSRFMAYLTEGSESMTVTWQLTSQKIGSRIFANMKFKGIELDGNNDEDGQPDVTRPDAFDLIEVSVMDANNIVISHVDTEILKELIDKGVLHGKYQNAIRMGPDDWANQDLILVTDAGNVIADNINNNSITFGADGVTVLTKDVPE
jgi:hypothetical protein